jgi:hypothetical protein
MKYEHESRVLLAMQSERNGDEIGQLRLFQCSN